MNLEKHLKFESVELNQLPQYSIWPYRLLGLEDWETRKRDYDLVEKEYGEKWGKLYNELESSQDNTLNSLINRLLATHFPDYLTVHIKENIYRAPIDKNFWEYIYSLIYHYLSPYLKPDDTLVELGSGWGRNLFWALENQWCQNIIGGEFTSEGRAVAEAIAKKFETTSSFYKFDYYKPTENFFKHLSNTVVFSHNSIEQISHLPEQTLETIARSGPKTVIHFEPVYENLTSSSLLHGIWRRYTEVNDYNRNLLTALNSLQDKGVLKIIKNDVHAFGLNALNPGSVIVWEPV